MYIYVCTLEYELVSSPKYAVAIAMKPDNESIIFDAVLSTPAHASPCSLRHNDQIQGGAVDVQA